MRYKQVFFVFITLILFTSLIANINLNTYAQDDESEWDFSGVIRVDSELRKPPVYHPEELDHTKPTVFPLSDISLEFNTSGNKLQWFPSDVYPGDYPDNYSVYRNDTLVQKGSWSSNQYITVNLDGLERGNYNYSIVVQDEKGNKAQDEVYVSVVNETAPYIKQVADIEFFEGNTVSPIVWHVTDKNLSNYVIQKNEGTVDSNIWSEYSNESNWNPENPTISYAISGLEVGEYNITLIVEDIYRQKSVDTVIVKVKDSSTIIHYENYEPPNLEIAVLGLDTNDDDSMDTYYGFYGMIEDPGVEGYFNKILEPYLGATWRMRIPEGSPANWEVLYYPDPIYDKIRPYLAYDAPVYYVNLTVATGVNLEYEIDLGTNTTYGNLTTYGPTNPLYPEVPEFPGYNYSIPYYSGTKENEFTVETDFFSSLSSMISIVSLSFLVLVLYNKRKRKMR
ncbi:MAG: hypothetical protein ACTSVB_05725 [Candidatus Heimdallarchaeaceae archaeon]|nr:MAG: hypothetical protein DRN69_08945 [Candidatus Pacearchaeota archaeon]